MFHTLRNRLRLQLVVLISLLALASAGAYALLTGGLARTQIVQEQFKLQRHLASRMASQLAHDMAARSQEMRFLSSLERMRDPSRAMADKQALLMAKKAAYPIYAWIGLTDTSGRIVASTEPRLNGADVSQRAWFKGGRNDLHFVDIHDAVLLGKLLPRPQHDELPLRLIDVALPVRNPQGEFMGVLAAHLSLDWTYELRDHLLDELEQEPLEMVLINHVGEVIVGSPSLPAQQVDLSRLSTVQHALAGRVSTAVEAWSDGRRYLSTAVPAMGNAAFPGLGWVVIVRTDEDTALAGARRLTQFTLLAGLAAALGFSGLMWRVVSRKLRPLERLSGSARELATSDLATPLPEPQGDGEVAVFTRSLTQLVNALRDSRARFQSLFEHAPVALIFANRDGDLLNHNTRFERLFGAGTERITHIDQWFESAFPDGAPRDEARRRWAQVRAMISGQPVEAPGAEYEIQRTDGTSRIVATSAIAMPDGVLVAFHDLTERRLAEREVQHLNAELERRVIERTAELSAANRELDSFAYTVSHDLRAPLRSVNGFAQLLATECADRLDTQGMDYLERMQASTRKMSELIEGLLARHATPRSRWSASRSTSRPSPPAGWPNWRAPSPADRWSPTSNPV